MDETDLMEGLEALRRAGRANTSRVLHDDIGPALCSAGLMLGLLRTEARMLPPESREWLDTLQTALEKAMESTRLLSYQTNPALAARCGLREALEYLARGRGLSLDWAAGVPEWTADQNEAGCRIIGDVFLAISDTSARLETCKEGLTLYSKCPLNLDGTQREVLKRIAMLYQLEIRYEMLVPTAIFSLCLLKAA